MLMTTFAALLGPTLPTPKVVVNGAPAITCPPPCMYGPTSAEVTTGVLKVGLLLAEDGSVVADEAVNVTDAVLPVGVLAGTVMLMDRRRVTPGAVLPAHLQLMSRLLMVS